MLDINFIRQNPDKTKNGIKRKGADSKIVDDFLAFDKIWRELIKEFDNLRASQKKLGKENIEEAKKIKQQIRSIEEELKQIETQREEALLQMPNLPFDDVPVGESEKENIILREVGKKPKLDFTPKDHLELAKDLDIIDFETAAKVSGSGFYYLKNGGVLLEMALMHFALDFLKEKGFSLWLTPDLAKKQFYTGTGYLPKGPEAQTYLIEKSELGLIATSEMTLAGIHSDEILKQADLPKYYAGYSHCFRQESGAYGKYSKGFYRVHQFSKVEMFVYAKPEESQNIHKKLLAIEEELWQKLGIPYRVLEMCTGDLGTQAARKFDLEAWMPGRDDWGEITSASNTTDYQARRLNIRFRKENGEIDFAHTLNGTAIAVSRAFVAILENYQQEDGSVLIPEVLQKYLGFSKISK